MMRYPLKSSFAEQIRSFVDYKNSLGFPYDESCRILWKFDNFCAERFPEKDSLDRELALAWLEKRDTENTAGHRNRIMVIREFAKYLRAVGTEAYMIPISMTSKGPRYVPHIFNEAEIKAFFHGADSFRPHGKAPARHLVVPVFYRLLYCCGLRPAEARLLKKENVDLVRGSVYVLKTICETKELSSGRWSSLMTSAACLMAEADIPCLRGDPIICFVPNSEN